ncbi:uncharacterized protein LOC6050122 [Culex quinquefasciatus]|uniref:uncharacterized protein LOC6050122 n=1 Tax=Culex quinquefasciatus TaxID=7176 RepID=UPI0018E2DA2A|nr:uncharacterized protein LOC6050122 [Culex quinquefasciatus]
MDSVQTLEALEIDVGDFPMEEQYLEEDPFADCPAGDGDTDGPSVSANPYQLDDSEFDNSAAPEQPDDSEFANSAASDQFDESAGEGGPSKKRKNKSKGKHDTSEDLFMCTLAVYKREFKGQTSGAYIAHWEVSGNSSADFVTRVWGLSCAYLNREIVFETNPDGESTPRWSTKEKPTEEDFKQFALFLSGRRPYTIDNILDNKQHLLQSWRGKEVSLLLHVYSLSVSNRSQWIKVKDTLIDPIEHDRAGAATTQALQELTEKLRSDHGKFLKGHDMAWSFWANAIHSAPAHQRSTMMQYPPESLASLFSIQEGVRMNAVRHELEAASNVNESYHDDIVEVRKAFEAFKVTLNRGLQTLDDRITRLETREHTSSSLINSMKTSVVVQEDAVGKNLNKKVSNCIDDQHSP